MRHLICMALMALASAPLAAAPAAPPEAPTPQAVRAPVPISLLRVGDEFFAPTRPRRLTEGDSIMSFAYSPAGERIAFASFSFISRTTPFQRSGTDPAEVFDGTYRGRIGVTDVRTGNARTLLPLPFAEGMLRGLAFTPNLPMGFSADGQWLAAALEFIDLDAAARGESRAQGRRLAVSRVSDGDVRWLPLTELFSSITRLPGDADLFPVVVSRFFAWHPRRPLLAYQREADGAKVIALWNAETGAEAVVAQGLSPKWSPDGSTLEYIRPEAHDEYGTKDESGRLISTAYRLFNESLRLDLGSTTPTPQPRGARDQSGRWAVKDMGHLSPGQGAALVVVDRETGRETVVVQPGPGGRPRPLEWSADGTLLLYSMTNEIADAGRARAKGIMAQYWVYNAAEPGPDSTAMVAVESWFLPEDVLRAPAVLEDYAARGAAWSPRGRQIAFVRDGDLWVTDLEPAGTFGVPSASLGMTEPEARSLAMRKMSQVASAAMRYAREHDGALPAGGRLEAELTPYLQDPNALYLPNNPGILAIEWLAQPGLNLNALGDAARTTAIAVMHWPPGMVVIAWANGNVSVMREERWPPK